MALSNLYLTLQSYLQPLGPLLLGVFWRTTVLIAVENSCDDSESEWWTGLRSREMSEYEIDISIFINITNMYQKSVTT